MLDKARLQALGPELLDAEGAGEKTALVPGGFQVDQSHSIKSGGLKYHRSLVEPFCFIVLQIAYCYGCQRHAF